LHDTKIEEITIGNGKYGFSGFIDRIDLSSLFRKLKSSQTLWWLDTYPVVVGMWIDKTWDALASGAHLKWGVGEGSILNSMTTHILEKWKRNQSNSVI